MNSGITSAIRPAIGPAIRSAFDGWGAPSLASQVAALFAASEQGAWYDPSDMSTLFQDAAGATPVYMPGQGQVDPPVGLLLDKRLGLLKGPELLTNGEFASDSGWTKNAGWGISGGSAVRAPDAASSTLTQNIPLAVGAAYVVEYTISSITAGSITPRLSGGVTVVGNSRTAAGTYKEVLVSAAGNTRLELYANAVANATIDIVSLRALPGNHAYQTTTTSRPTLSARYNLLTATDTLTTQSVTTVATSYTLKLTGAGSVTLSGTAAGSYSAGTYTITCTAGSLTLTVSGSVTQADLRIANDGVGLPPYQRVVDANTYDTAGFPLYLKFDGVDDAMQTIGNIDFTGTDKMTVWAGVRKSSDAALGYLLSMGSTGGRLDIRAPTGALSNISANAISSAGASIFATTTAIGVAANTNINYAAIVDFAAAMGSECTSRVNGVVVPQTAGLTQENTGVFGNKVLTIGALGSSSYFNGRIYQLIVRGAQSSLSQIEAAELYTRRRMMLP